MEEKLSKIEEEEYPREERKHTEWELEITDIIAIFRNIRKGYIPVVKPNGEIAWEKLKAELGNDNIDILFSTAVWTENKLTSLSDTNERIMLNICGNLTKAFLSELNFNREVYGLNRYDNGKIRYLTILFGKLIYQLSMKSVGGGERAYRGKIIERREIYTPQKEEKKWKIF
ncbi:MAG: hypothetical protein QXP34_03525 [Candidatus Aenigmatarchaeota archaeon]